MPVKSPPKKITRRQFLKRAAAAYGGLAIGSVPKAASAKKPAEKKQSAKPKRKYSYKGPYEAEWGKLLKKRPYSDWPNSYKGRRCIKVTDRAAQYAKVKPATVLETVRSRPVSRQTLIKLEREYTAANNALSKLDRSTKSNKKRWDQLDARMKKINTDWTIIRTLVDADMVRATFSDLPEAELPPSGSELASAVGGSSRGLFDWLHFRKKPAQPLQAQGTETVRQTKAKPSFEKAALPPGRQWQEIFKTYPGWKRAINHPQLADNARAAISMVERVSKSTDSKPMDVIAVRRKYTITRHTLPRYSGISMKERRIFDALLEEQKSNKKAFDYMMRVTRSWFANN